MILLLILICVMSAVICFRLACKYVLLTLGHSTVYRPIRPLPWEQRRARQQ